MDRTGQLHDHLFVYGTLRPGEVRWRHLAPFVIDDGIDATASGDVYDTGLGYPAARFDGAGRIVGRLYRLTRVAEAIELLDAVEQAVRGRYERVVVTTHDGVAAWAYQCGDAELLVRRIPSGDWTRRS